MTEIEKLFQKLYPEFCTGDKCLSPYFDIFDAAMELNENKIEELKEEQIEQKAEKYAEELIKYKMAKHDIFVKEEAKKEIMDIYIAGAKENGVVWHDLRKNPQDLPKDNKDVYVATLSPYEEKENAYEYGFDSWNGEEWFITAASDVVAWRETPIFEE